MRYTYVRSALSMQIARTKEFEGGVLADFTEDDRLVGIEYPEHLTYEEALDRVTTKRDPDFTD